MTEYNLIYILIGTVCVLLLLMLFRKKKIVPKNRSVTKDTTKVDNFKYSSVQNRKSSSNSKTAKRRGILDQAPSRTVSVDRNKQQVVKWTTTTSYTDDIKKLNEYEKNLIKDSQGEEEDFKLFILLVDDSLVVRKYISDLLVNNDYKVVAKNDGKEGLEYLNSITEKPDLIISDIEMPVMNGFEFINKIREDINYEEIPILVISAHAESHLSLMEEEKIQGFIKKPFANEDLLSQINYLIHS